MEYGEVLLRLSDDERTKLQIIVTALKVSDYSDDVDDFRRQHSREARMKKSIYEFINTVTGLYASSGFKSKGTGSLLISGNTNGVIDAHDLENLFEILRRHKRLNPFANRAEFGKLMMLLQDIQKSTIRRELQITSNLVTPVQTVGALLGAIGCGELLSKRNLIEDYISKRGSEKENLLSELMEKYSGGSFEKAKEIERCLRSIDDVQHFLNANIYPLKWLQDTIEKEFLNAGSDRLHNLEIRRGTGGSCLSHSHESQCSYVLESLRLWENVQQRIFKLWQAAEDDMIVDSQGFYQFSNTGQGYHRMCRAPKSYSCLSSIVNMTEKEMGKWIGIKVIHLGDNDVPNPLVFIDKYTIIPRIVQPIVHTITTLKSLFDEDHSSSADSSKVEYPGIRNLLKAKYSNYEKLRLMILSDFFRHAFDGSGDDGGNCIDGRLTSAWNWCSNIEKKSYYDAFVLTGFNGFD